MEKIKVGEYVRTKLGDIKQIIEGFEFIIERLNSSSNKIVKHSFNILDLIEDEDIAVLEYKSPKYKKRVTRRFEVFKIDDGIRFENAYCNFYCKVGDKRITDKICKNIKVKSIVTKEQFESIKYVLR